MKRTVFGMAAAAMLFAGCSKEELVDETMPSEGINSVASTPGQEKNFWSSAPSIWFSDNNGRMFVRLKGDPPQTTTIRADIRITFQGAGGQSIVDPNDDPTNEEFETVVELQRIGNSRFYRSVRNAVDIPEAFDFSLASINISGGDENIWNGDVFLYPSGRTVAQNPSIIRVRRGPEIQLGDGANGRRMAVVVADDPTQQVVSVIAESVCEDEDGVTQKTRVALEETHSNQNLGLRRFRNDNSGLLCGVTDHFLVAGGGSYGVDFLDEAANTVIIKKYDVSGDGTGFVPTNEVDEPEFLGAQLGSKTGGSWTYTVAIADLGDWVESATLTFPEQEGVFPTQNEFDMQLIRAEGNLKVFQVDRILFEGLEPGTEVQALVSANGKGTKKAASTIRTNTVLTLL